MIHVILVHNELCIIMMFWQHNKCNKSGSLKDSSHMYLNGPLLLYSYQVKLRSYKSNTEFNSHAYTNIVEENISK